MNDKDEASANEQAESFDSGRKGNSPGINDSDKEIEANERGQEAKADAEQTRKEDKEAKKDDA